MYLQEIVEVAIGLIFAWLLLSIAVLQVQEVIANVLAKRSSELENVIRDMLKDPEKVKKFYDHPLIKSLSKPKILTPEKEKIAQELEKRTISLGRTVCDCPACDRDHLTFHPAILHQRSLILCQSRDRKVTYAGCI